MQCIAYSLEDNVSTIRQKYRQKRDLAALEDTLVQMLLGFHVFSNVEDTSSLQYLATNNIASNSMEKVSPVGKRIGATSV